MGDPLAHLCWYPFFSQSLSYMWNPSPLGELHYSLLPNLGIYTIWGTVNMCHLEGPILFFTDHCPNSVVHNPHHTEFVLEGVVRGKVEILIIVCHFSIDGDFQGAAWLSHCISVQRGQCSILLPLNDELDVWVQAVQVISKTCPCPASSLVWV